MIVDTHCHLDYLKSKSIQETLNDCLENGVEKIVTIAVSPDNQRSVVELAEANSMVYCSQGVHPHDASQWSKESLQEIEQNLEKPKVVAVGEIGLDYHYEHSPRPKQRNVFEQQIEIAIQYQKPIIIHTREAEDDTLAILKNFESQVNSPVVLHSFTSSIELAEYAFTQNYFLGFNGIVTFKAASNVREVLTACPLENLVVETDAPYLAPVPYRGRENTSAYLPAIVQYIASHKQVAEEILRKQLYENSHRLFQL